MTSFDDHTTPELIAEIERRTNAERPDALALSHIRAQGLDEQVYDYANKYINGLAEKGYVDDALEQYIFEAVMEMVFGKNVWDFINKAQ